MQSDSLTTNLHQARKNKNDEFYTQLADIESELQHYKPHLVGKVIYCNCDDPKTSKFFQYFKSHFEKLRLKRLIITCYKNQSWDLFSINNNEKAVHLEYAGKEIEIKYLQGDGDFRSKECIELLKQSDIVVTNPPFSLFRKYVAQLFRYDKKFLIIGNQNAITYKEILKLIKENKLWIGNMPMNNDMLFDVPQDLSDDFKRNKKEGSGYKIINGVVKARAPANWFTNLDIKKRHEDFILYRTYNPQDYPTYDNHNGIEVSKTKDIPCDYSGVMGVPITFLDKYNPKQFEILGLYRPSLQGKKLYNRITIRKNQNKMKYIISPYYDFCKRWERATSISLILQIVGDETCHELKCGVRGVRIAFDAPAPKESGYDYVIEARNNGTNEEKHNAAEFFTWYGLKKRKEQGTLLIFGKAGDVLDQYVFCDTSCYLQGNYLSPLWLTNNTIENRKA